MDNLAERIAQRTKQELINECEVGKDCHQASCGVCKDIIAEMSDKEVRKAQREETERYVQNIDLKSVKAWKCSKCSIRVAKGHADAAIHTCKLQGRGCGLEQLMEVVQRISEKQQGIPKIPKLLQQPEMPTDKCPLKKPCFSGGCGDCRNEILKQNGQAVVEVTKLLEQKVPVLEYEIEVDDPIRITISKKGQVSSSVESE